MRRAIAACLLAAATLVAQPGSALGLGFRSIYSRDGLDVWAVGDTGAVFRSFDGGQSWGSSTLGTGNLNGVAARGFLVLIVGDGGEVRRSTDSGGSFAVSVLPGGLPLRAIEMVDASTGWIVGDGGKIFATVNGGQSWTAQVSGTSARLQAVRFRNPTEGWAVGANGTVRHTTNCGATWLPVDAGTTRLLRSVDFIGSTIWIVGNDATCRKSTNGGASFASVDLKLDSRSDVTGVWLETALTVFLTGGGGFIRKSTDGGATWTFQTNPVLAETSDLFFMPDGVAGWVSHTATRAIANTTDGGANWNHGAFEQRTWVRKQAVVAGSIRGNTICLNGQNKNSVYAVLGLQIYKSTDRGETWGLIGTIAGGGTKTNAFYVSPHDSLLMVAATGIPDRITRSTDGGATWTTRFTIDFSEFGVPLEMNRDKPDTLLFGPEDGRLWISPDFGDTWSLLSIPGFRSPCDIHIVQDHNDVIWVADGVTGLGLGDLFRSTDSGQNFSLIYSTTGSEIPMLAGSHIDPSRGFATAWSSGGVRRTTDMGATWSVVHPAAASWGCDIAKDDPNVCIFGVFVSGGAGGLSLYGGASGTWDATSIQSTNYAFEAIDRATILALQGDGIYKMVQTYTMLTDNTQGVAVISPNGGESWGVGEHRTISWSATHLALARIEYRPLATAAWKLIAQVEGYAGSMLWTVPDYATSEAQIRISDAWDGSPQDTSNSPFSITAPFFSATPDSVDFGAVNLGSTEARVVSIGNGGTSTLTVSSIVDDGNDFEAVQGMLVVPPLGAASLELRFTPSSVGPQIARFTLVSNDTGSPHRIVARAQGRLPSDTESAPLAFGLSQDGANPFVGSTTLRYRVAERTRVTIDVFDLQGRRVATLVDTDRDPGEYAVPFGSYVTTATGRRTGALAAGVYFAHMRAGSFSKTHKLVLSH